MSLLRLSGINTFYGQMSVFATQTSTVSSASLAIVPPQPLLTINKNVSLTATVPAFSSISICFC